MANLASPKNGLIPGTLTGARTNNDLYGPLTDENQPHGRAPALTPTARGSNSRRSSQPVTPNRKLSTGTKDGRIATRPNGDAYGNNNSDEDIPENMYRPEKDDPEGWIHRDKLAKIESEELQAAGINLANARSRSQSRIKSVRSVSSSEGDKKDEKRQRLQSPAEIEEEIDRARWDFRLPEEIEAEAEAEAAAQMYANPLLRKSGSKIPVMTSSPLPIPSERYERDTPIARKRTASGTMSLENDLSVSKIRNGGSNKTPDDSDGASSAVASSKPGSPNKPRSKSATLPAGHAAQQKKPAVAGRKVSGPPRTTPSPSQRPTSRSGDQDRPRTSYTSPEGDPPWLATMYKPDPRLPPDQQLIPTLAKKQMQAKWAAEGAVPKAYDKEFEPIDIHDADVLQQKEPIRYRTPSPVKNPPPDDRVHNSNAIGLGPVNSVRSNTGRPETSGSITGGYSTMPKLTSPSMRESNSPAGNMALSNNPTTSAAKASPTRMQAQNLAFDEDEKAKKGCACCVVM